MTYVSALVLSEGPNISRSEFLATAAGRQVSFVLVSVVACVTSSYCYSSSSSGEFLELPAVLRTKSSILPLLVYLRLFLIYILVSDVDFRFSEILNLLCFLGALSFKPYNFCSFRGCSSLWLQAHTVGWRHVYAEWICPIKFSVKFCITEFCL